MTDAAAPAQIVVRSGLISGRPPEPRKPDAPRAALLLSGSAALGVTIPLYAVIMTLVAASTGDPDATRPSLQFFPRYYIYLRPEPSEQAVFLSALTFPLTLAIATWLLRGPATRPFPTGTFVRLLAVIGQALVALIVVLCIYKQFLIHDYSSVMTASALAAGCLTAMLFAAPSQFRGWQPRAVGPAAAWAAAGACIAATIVVAVGSVYTDATVGTASPETWGHLPYTSEEFAAVLNGATPLVDFTSQYTNVLPLLLEPVFAALGGVTTGTFTSVMGVLSCGALLCVYVCLRMVAGPTHPLRSATLYAAFLLATAYPTYKHAGRLHDVLTYPALMPMRYGLPLLLAPLMAWAGIQPSWRRDTTVAALSAMALVNNLDFGLPAFGAAWLASAVRGRLCTPQTWRAIWLHPAMAIVAFSTYGALALMRSQHLPDLAALVYYPRQFAVSGFYMLPMPGVFGLHLVMFLTTAVMLAFGLVTALALRKQPSGVSPLPRARTSTLVYAATFALGASSYYAGRSDINVLPGLFCAWSLSLGVFLSGVRPPSQLLRLVSRRHLLLITPVAATLGGAFGLCLGAVGPDLTFATQLGHLATASAMQPMSHPEMQKFVESNTEGGDAVVIVYPRGYSIAKLARVRNWFPFADPEAVVTADQVREIARAIRTHDARAVFTSQRFNPRGLELVLRRQGFRLTATWHQLQMWRDTDPAGSPTPTATPANGSRGSGLDHSLTFRRDRDAHWRMTHKGERGATVK